MKRNKAQLNAIARAYHAKDVAERLQVLAAHGVDEAQAAHIAAHGCRYNAWRRAQKKQGGI